MIRTCLLAWFPMVFIAIANGVARDKGYKRQVGELRAHQFSTLSAAILFTAYTRALSLHWPLPSAGQAILVGVIWFCLTIAFEIGFGHFVVKYTWRRLALDYNLLKGRVWALLLIWVMALPHVVRCLQP